MSGRQTFSGNTRTNPRWLATFMGRETLIPAPAKLDKASFTNFYGVAITLTGNAVVNATSLAVTALTPPSPSTIPITSLGQVVIKRGSILNFGSGKFARTTADVAYGATAIPVEALGVQINSGDTTNYDAFGTIYVPSGILIGRTFANRATNGPWVAITDPNLVDEIGLLAFDIQNLLNEDDCEIIMASKDVVVKENYLPQYTAYAADTGIADPAAAPSLSVAGADGSFGVGSYVGAYTWGNANGETKLSPTAAIAVGSTNHLTFASLAFPSGVTFRNFYVGRAIGDPNVVFQGTQAAAGAYNALTPGTGGKGPSTNNTKSGAGRSLDAIRRLFTTVTGKD